MNRIETIARGVCVRGGKVLLCAPKGGAYNYLPGGHIEFGETGREALEREMKEETGLKSKAGALVGVVESMFVQKGRKHAEINLIYRLALKNTKVASRESWIEFKWWPVKDLRRANLLPAEMIKYVK